MSELELFIYFLAGIAYFIPFYVASYRNVNGKNVIFWMNLLFGWTLIAWVLLIIAAFSVDNRNPTS